MSIQEILNIVGKKELVITCPVCEGCGEVVTDGIGIKCMTCFGEGRLTLEEAVEKFGLDHESIEMARDENTPEAWTEYMREVCADQEMDRRRDSV